MLAFVLLACNARNDSPDRDASAGAASGSGGRGSLPTGGDAGSDAGDPPSVDPVCGNGVLETGEQCDGAADLEKLTCQILGLGVGVVRCVACRLNTRDCAPALAGCPVEPREANGAACFDPELRCQYGAGCGSGGCRCVLDDPQDAGAADDPGRDGAPPIAHFSCAWTAC